MVHKYINPNEKFSGIKTMGLQTYQALLNSEEMQEDLREGLEIANNYAIINNLRDKRRNLPLEAKEYTLFLINNYKDLKNRDFLLKTVYLQIVFADNEMFESMNNDNIDMPIRHFASDENNVLCKRALNTKLNNLEKSNTLVK